METLATLGRDGSIVVAIGQPKLAASTKCIRRRGWYYQPTLKMACVFRVSRDHVSYFAYHASSEAPLATYLASNAHRWRYQVKCSSANMLLD